MGLSDHYLLFSLDQRRHAIPLSIVERVVRAVEILPLPNSPDEVLGVINVQGRIIPVLSLRKQFGLSERGVQPEDQIIITNSAMRSVAFLVDAALDVIARPESSSFYLTEPSHSHTHSRQVMSVGDELVLFHDSEHLMEARLLDGPAIEALQI